MLLFSSPFAAVYLLTLCGIAGLVMGSALNCLALRIVSGERWSKGRSHCVHCGHALQSRELIPLFSYLWQKGKCRWCGKPISPRYPAAEAALAIIYITLLIRFDLSLDALNAMILCSCLFCLSLVDLDIQIIPDRFLVISAAARLVFLLAGRDFALLGGSLLRGLLLGGSVLVLSLIMDKVLKKESMGGGDIKLLFVLGLYFSLPCCFFLIIAACILGIVLALLLGAKEGIAFPFGPALSLAAWLTLLVGEPITGWYMGLF